MKPQPDAENRRKANVRLALMLAALAAAFAIGFFAKIAFFGPN